MRQALVKMMRKQARVLFVDQPYVSYTTNNNGSTVMTDFCIKKVVKDSKRNVKYETRQQPRRGFTSP